MKEIGGNFGPELALGFGLLFIIFLVILEASEEDPNEHYQKAVKKLKEKERKLNEKEVHLKKIEEQLKMVQS